MAGDKVIYINGHKWKDVTDQTTSELTYTYEEEKRLSYWPYKRIETNK